MGTRGYEEQYKRMKRWYRRLEDIYRGKEQSGDKGCDTEYYQDEMHAFFQNCYHLQDWLKEDQGLLASHPNIKDLVKDFVNNGPDCVKICHGLCIGSKHMVIRNTQIDPNTGVKNRALSLYMGKGPPIVAMKFNIEGLGGNYDALLLAEACISAWDNFMTTHNIPIPPDAKSKRDHTRAIL